MEVFSEENSEEVGRLVPIVDAIHTRVAELLLQWPEHATLQLIQQLCERLKGFRIGSALMRERPRRPLEGECTSKRKSLANASSLQVWSASQ